MHDRMIVDMRNELRRIDYRNMPRISDFKRLKYNMPSDDFLDQGQLAGCAQRASECRATCWTA